MRHYDVLYALLHLIFGRLNYIFELIFKGLSQQVRPFFMPLPSLRKGEEWIDVKMKNSFVYL